MNDEDEELSEAERRILEAERRLRAEQERLRDIERRLQQGEDTEELLRELEDGEEPMGERDETPSGNIADVVEQAVDRAMEEVGRRLDAVFGTEDFERRMDDVGKKVQEALSKVGPRFEANGRRVLISGSGVVALDRPVEIFKCSGSGKVEGNLQAKVVRISGACRVEGNCEAEEFHSSGSTKIGGGLRATELHSSGSTMVAGDVFAREFHTSGSSRIGGNVEKAQEIHTSGNLRVDGRIQVKEFQSHGRFQVANGIEAETILVRLHGTSRTSRMTADDIDVRQRRHHGSLKVGTVEGKQVYLEGTVAERVRGDKVRIGPYSTVDVVEANQIEVHETSTVKERRPLAGGDTAA